VLGFLFSKEISILANKNKERIRQWTEEHVANADYFVVRMFLGRGEYDIVTAKTLREARQAKRDMIEKWKGQDYGHSPAIYVVTKGIPLTVHVE
jgi:hypothetical protein